MEREYYGLEPSSQLFMRKNLLFSEMKILTVLKRYENFKRLRTQELTLKKLLKKLVSETNEELKKLSESLPRPKYEAPKKSEFNPEKRSEIEREIDEIKRKIADLQ